MLPHYSCPSHSSYGAAPAYFCTAPKKHREGQRNRRAWVSPGGLPFTSGPSLNPEQGQATSRANPLTPRNPFAGRGPEAPAGTPAGSPKPCPSHCFPYTNTTGAERWNGRETLPAFYWLSLLSIIKTPPHVVVLVIAIRRAVTSPTRARSSLIPLRAVCKGNTAVKRAAGRSQ